MNERLIQDDLRHVWHPCTYMQDFEKDPPLIVERASGSYIYTDQGPLIDAISSWWCKSLGHGHPAIIQAIQQQLSRFEHVIGANTTHPKIVELAKEISDITKLQHVYFASDGSSSVEIALKLALQASQCRGYPERKQIITLQNSYHGETLGALSVSDLDLYKRPFRQFSLPVYVLDNIPYVSQSTDSLWHSSDDFWPLILKQLENQKEKTAAIILEPIIQGVGHMNCYSADFLKKLAKWAKQNEIYLIADEIMTGCGRTGKWLALEHANIQADMVCLSKGLTSGSLPLSCVAVDHAIYDLFYHDRSAEHSFLHSHTYSGHALAVSAALATIQTMRCENTIEQAAELGHHMRKCFQQVIQQTKKLTNFRSVGAVVAADLTVIDNPRIGYQLRQSAQKMGALLRPIGNTLYWLPPLNTEHSTIDALADITAKAIESVYN